MKLEMKWHSSALNGEVLKRGCRVLGSVWRCDGTWYAQAQFKRQSGFPNRDKAKEWVQRQQETK